jgi:hypothetical protein
MAIIVAIQIAINILSIWTDWQRLSPVTLEMHSSGESASYFKLTIVLTIPKMKIRIPINDIQSIILKSLGRILV